MHPLLIFIAFLAIATAQPTAGTPWFTGGPVEVTDEELEATEAPESITGKLWECDGYPSQCDRTCGCPIYTIDNPWVEKHFPGDSDLDRIYRKVELKWDGCTPIPQKCTVGSQLRMTADSPSFLMPHVEDPWKKLTRVCNTKTKSYDESSGWWTCLPLD